MSGGWRAAIRADHNFQFGSMCANSLRLAGSVSFLTESIRHSILGSMTTCGVGCAKTPHSKSRPF